MSAFQPGQNRPSCSIGVVGKPLSSDRRGVAVVSSMYCGSSTVLVSSAIAASMVTLFISMTCGTAEEELGSKIVYAPIKGTESTSPLRLNPPNGNFATAVPSGGL